jgi:cathepsin B
MLMLLFLLTFTLALPSSSSGSSTISIDTINSVQNTWTAKLYKLPTPKLGVLENYLNFNTNNKDNNNIVHGIPDGIRSFDWRNTSYANCIGPIQQQGKCGSCWAVSTIESVADRFCLFSQRNTTTPAPTTHRQPLSVLDLIACDKMCQGIEQCCRGCVGGYPKLAFEYVKKKGVVSDQCMPWNISKSLLCPVPKCLPPLLDKTKKVKDVMQVYNMVDEIQKNGPVVATFTVYEDFMHYSSGIYNYSGIGKRLGFHAVKVLGFGINVKTGMKYYNCQNSWGQQWGNNGSFQIYAETCGFQSSVYTATPCLKGDICV